MVQQLTQYQITGISRKSGRKRKKKYFGLNEEEVQLKADKDEIEVLSINSISEPLDYEIKLPQLSKNDSESLSRNIDTSPSILDFMLGCSSVWVIFQLANSFQGV